MLITLLPTSPSLSTLTPSALSSISLPSPLSPSLPHLSLFTLHSPHSSCSHTTSRFSLVTAASSCPRRLVVMATTDSLPTVVGATLSVTRPTPSPSPLVVCLHTQEEDRDEIQYTATENTCTHHLPHTAANAQFVVYRSFSSATIVTLVALDVAMSLLPLGAPPHTCNKAIDLCTAVNYYA